MNHVDIFFLMLMLNNNYDYNDYYVILMSVFLEWWIGVRMRGFLGVDALARLS